MGERLIPGRYRFLSGSALKVIAAVTMLIDHTAAALLKNSRIVLFFVGDFAVTLYNTMRFIGRLSFPIFAFLLVEGFLHTRNRVRYGISLGVLAVISELPWNLEHTGTLLYGYQNVMFTLLLGYLALCAVERFKDNAPATVAILFGILVITYILNADYSYFGYCFVIVLYMLRSYPPVRAVVGSCVLPARWAAGLAFIPIAFYNGRRGFIKGRALQYAFYLFYPVHLFVLYLIKYVFK